MEIIDIHAHVYPTVCGITNSLPMTSQPLGRVKVGNEIRQFLPPFFPRYHQYRGNRSSPIWIGAEFPARC